jgi:multidrug efflux system outer membrane protein
MIKLKTLVVAVAIATTSACSLMPEYLRPQAPVPEAFPHADAKAASSATQLSDIAWQDYFADAQLREVIEIALNNNRDLRVAALNIEKARALYRVQRADLYPRVGITGTENVQRLPGDLTSSGDANTTRQYSATIGFSAYELDFFGRIRSLNAQALEQYLGTEEAKRSAQISLIAEVANAWLTLAADKERLALARSTLETRQKSYELIRRTFEVGVGSALDVRQAESLMEASRADVARYAAQEAKDANALALIAGTSVSADLLPAKLSDTVSAITDVPAGVPSEVLTRRPDVLQAERALRAANANIGAARAAFFPSITLTAGAGIASDSLGGLFSGGGGTWSFIPQIRLPIFEAGRLTANLEATKVQREINVAQYEKSIQTAFREVADAFAEKSTLTERLDARRKLVDATKASFTLSEARYKGGIDSYLGFLDSQRALYLAQLELIEIRLIESANRVALYKVLGGGWHSADKK